MATGAVNIITSKNLVTTLDPSVTYQSAVGLVDGDAVLDGADTLWVARATASGGPTQISWVSEIFASSFTPQVLAATVTGDDPVWMKTPEGVIYLFCGGNSYLLNTTTRLLQSDSTLTALAGIGGPWTYAWWGDELFIAVDDTAPSPCTITPTRDRGRSFRTVIHPSPISGVDARHPRLVIGPTGVAALVYWDQASMDLKVLISRDYLTTWTSLGTVASAVPEQWCAALLWDHKMAVTYTASSGMVQRRECRSLNSPAIWT